MDHNEAIGQKATERYLLNELDPVVREEFEDHLFDCQECALDVRAAAMFVEESKVVLAEPPVAVPVRVPFPVPAPAKWAGWFRPAIAVPVFALLLVTIGYQNLVTYPQLQAMNAPQVLPSASINISTRGSSVPVIPVTRDKGFLLFLRIPPETGVSSYKVDLINPADKLEWTLNLPLAPGQDSWTVNVPAAQRDSGKYTLQVHSVSASGQITDVGFPTPFELQIAK